ncbi:2-amino-4-hydroxy-6-hydroxymethyldihydropteridinediphosphokinase [Rhodobacter sp. JA431]|uniref:2-amino-4-hydroxy-6- hydroxymethyldihydropteridine diphosphokinase n=1 Tax=Rhodobacter sp. JA431 TaxID=570013 RepID=UPI000BCA4A93|nr:2-amino-4-hydroxy-6-hydroxymethyldihydropteridine diphosphokinase [Rhodobacter sp. JA431]SOB93454.1 2-amino-4-hydroxy-6-hydroxymethyldihydropteridinediphosphokinase [Rhodobacter sp. JA431]
MYTSTFFIAFGANLPSFVGSPAQSIVTAMDFLRSEALNLKAISRFYRSPAFPAGSGPDYVNGCAVFEATLPAEATLAALHRVEARLGRVREKRWGARGIDLDLIAVGQTILPDPQTQAHWRGLPLEQQMTEAPDQLILPHPRLADRAFVLIPFAEIAPLWRHPATGKTVQEMVQSLDPAEKAALVPFSAPFGGVGGLSSPDQATK